MPSPGLDRRDPAGTPRGLVLMLHGGASSRLRPCRPAERLVPVVRLPCATPSSPESSSRDCRSGCSGSGSRGWNAEARTPAVPVPDARWALDEAADAHPGVPVVLLGHSMGGRTAIHVADHPNVAGVVALAPWFQRLRPGAPLTGRHLVAGHGSRDRITSARATRAYVDRASHVADSARFVDMGRLGHYMLHRPGAWNRFALRSTLEVLDLAASGEAGPIRDAREECLDRRDG